MAEGGIFPCRAQNFNGWITEIPKKRRVISCLTQLSLKQTILRAFILRAEIIAENVSLAIRVTLLDKYCSYRRV